ncbi:hypothetical protein [Citreimonas sp.]|uniref:hypothetical protein n=1 Tax=Citreimonas sp. TaxID=3036715 RepID=UPI0035C87A71
MRSYSVALRRFQTPQGQARGILQNANTYQPSIIGSLYEASLSRRCASPNTLYRALTSAQALLSWANDTNIDLERQLLAGIPLDIRDIEAFAHWLEMRCRKDAATLTRASIKTYNAHLAGAERMVTWFVDQYYDIAHEKLPRGVLLDALHRTSRRAWKSQHIKEAADSAAPDLSDDDISTVETFLHSAAKANNAEPRWVRAYLIWRLAIEFGMRIGEILALRLEDCPSRANPAFRVVRIEDRKGSPDPRGVYAPRPKTLGRDLAPILSNTAFPHLVIDYQVDHRLKRVRRASGRVVRRPVLSHTYLLVDDEGNPLSVFTARNLAKAIEHNTGVLFSWHLARHAFFNRAYSAVAGIEFPTERTIRLGDLIYWGGWRDPGSLDCYVRRARKDRARTGIAIWNGSNRWDALE